MQVQIQTFKPASALREQLEKDGWLIDVEPDGCLMASHAKVASEEDARLRLHHLGLLTSQNLQIDFHSGETNRPNAARWERTGCVN